MLHINELAKSRRWLRQPGFCRPFGSSAEEGNLHGPFHSVKRIMISPSGLNFYIQHFGAFLILRIDPADQCSAGTKPKSLHQL